MPPAGVPMASPVPRRATDWAFVWAFPRRGDRVSGPVGSEVSVAVAQLLGTFVTFACTRVGTVLATVPDYRLFTSALDISSRARVGMCCAQTYALEGGTFLMHPRWKGLRPRLRQLARLQRQIALERVAVDDVCSAQWLLPSEVGVPPAPTDPLLPGPLACCAYRGVRVGEASHPGPLLCLFASRCTLAGWAGLGVLATGVEGCCCCALPPSARREAPTLSSLCFPEHFPSRYS